MARQEEGAVARATAATAAAERMKEVKIDVRAESEAEAEARVEARKSVSCLALPAIPAPNTVVVWCLGSSWLLFAHTHQREQMR